MFCTAESEVGYPLNRFKSHSNFELRPCHGGTSDVVLYVPCFAVSFCTVSPSEYLGAIYLGIRS